MDKTNFNWRTAPRSIYRMIEWLPYFARFEHEDYGLHKLNQDVRTSKNIPTIYPTRRAIRYAIEQDAEDADALTELSFEDFINGKQPDGDLADKESKIRQIVTTAEQYGFMDHKTAKLTEAGRRVVEGTFTGEDFLSQMLKMYVMVDDDHGVFPFRTVIKLIDRFDYMSRNEMTFVFGVIDDSYLTIAEEAITDFREKYSQLPARNNNKAVERLVLDVWNVHFQTITMRKLTTMMWDYTDALRRAMEFTELFYSHGRGTATKMRVTELNYPKFKMLAENFEFILPPKVKLDNAETQVGSRNNLEWFGAIGNVKLPWDKSEQRRMLVQQKIKKATALISEIPRPKFTSERANELLEKASNAEIVELKDIDIEVDSAVLNIAEEIYVQDQSKTSEARKEIIDRYDTIISDNDMSALWLEVNTWRAFVSLDGDGKKVVHNFKMNPDLTPKSFAPGTGNTPDMEVYYGNSLIIPEVSLMTGTVQWEHEASSVIDHVLHKIREQESKDVRVIGLFISSKMNVRTMWQFFLLNRESWIGQPVPVVPLTINQFVKIIKTAYEFNADIFSVSELINAMSEATLRLNSYELWGDEIENLIRRWRGQFNKAN